MSPPACPTIRRATSSGASTAHRIVRAEGPERLADEWWRPRPDGSRPPANTVPPFRDYYRVEDDDGGRFWLFRDGPTRRPPTAGRRPAGSSTVSAPEEKKTWALSPSANSTTGTIDPPEGARAASAAARSRPICASFWSSPRASR